jgi:proteasome assembly chaperone (PAC2) family protein
MASEKLRIYKEPEFNNANLLIGLSGWMDGGNISTGTVKLLAEQLYAQKLAEIEPEQFYIYNFPGSMELTALFRPHTKIKDGLVVSCKTPKNIFFGDPKNNLIFFVGKEPNLHWAEYIDCIFSLCARFDVKMIYFIGSVAGLVPHTRQPRFTCSVSDEKLKQTMTQYGVSFSNYEGPASIITQLTAQANQHNLGMATLVAEIPAYVQGHNPKCIATVAKLLATILNIHLDFDKLRNIADRFEKKLTEIVQAQPELATHITRLEEDYDNEVFDTEMGDLKKWLEQQGIRVD